MLSSSQLIPGGLTDKYLAEGGSQASSYVKRLIAQRQVDVNRIKKPSSWLLNVYPTLVRPSGISRDRAATRIQSLFRGRRGRREAQKLKRYKNVGRPRKNPIVVRRSRRGRPRINR